MEVAELLRSTSRAGRVRGGEKLASALVGLGFQLVGPLGLKKIARSGVFHIFLSTSPQTTYNVVSEKHDARAPSEGLLNLRQDDAEQIGNLHAFLLHGIAMPKRDRILPLIAAPPEGIEIDRDAEWGA